MKRKIQIISALAVVAALGTGGFVATASAHGDDDGRRDGMVRMGHPGGKGAHMMQRMLDRYDTNGDGVLGVEEAKAARAAQFKKFDKNDDGTLDLTEYQALWMDAMHERMVRRFQQHDTDGDAGVTEAEFTKDFSRMMSWMDRNEDRRIDKGDRPKKQDHD